MAENKLSIICSSFLKQCPPSHSNTNLPSISYISSPQHHRVERPLNFFDFGGKCYSPRICNQTSKTDLYSPSTFSTMKEIETQTKISTQFISKVKRTTLPAPLLKQRLAAVQLEGLSPPKGSQATRIRFTYNQSQLHSSQAIENNSANKQSRVFLFPSRTSKAYSLFETKQKKINKNRLCSCQFSQYFSPLQQIRRKNRQMKELLKSLQLQTEMLTNRSYHSQDISKISNVTQAESQRSGVGETKVSEMTWGSRRWDSQVQTGKGNLIGFDMLRPSLADQVPSAKQLGKTIILPSTSYDFGGLVPSTSEIAIEERSGKENRIMDWDHLKGLLYSEGQQDLKESIHCGPDVRAGNMDCLMLKGFGREIKESSMSYQE